MGCYMSKPDDQVYVTEGKGRNFTYATASCQGWRREQEDAEACIPDFDDDASLFILCDGHGGAEVAKYTVQHFPSFLKEHPLYKEGKYEEALEQAFIDFDATLRTDSVMNELTKLAFDEDKDNLEENDADNEAMDCKEESKSVASATNVEASGSSCGPSGSSSLPSVASSSSAGPSKSNGAITVVDDVDTDTLRLEAQVPIEELISKYANKEGKGRILSLRQAAIGNSPVIKSKDHEDTDSKPETSEPSSSTNDAGDQAGPSSSKVPDENPSSTSSLNQEKDSHVELIYKVLSGALEEVTDSDFDSDFDGIQDSTSDEEEEDEDEDGDDECDDDVAGEKTKNKRLLNKKQRRSAADRDDSSSEDDDDDDDDSDDYEDSEDEEVDNDDEEDDEEEEDGELEDDGDIISGKFLQRKLNQNLKASKVHRPVMDSGCTVVVALVKGKKLYVGSAGDSRCIVIMRNGQCKPMSFDHKPEDPIEHRRILNAGGQVVEGRVNGGLNLSRAFGDFTYKNTSLDAKKQMITPCPDVRTIDLDPDQVEYIFLACDGIWNSMKNQQVTKYIRETAPTVNNDLVDICMAVFKNCLAPGTDGDGTGCDNMTCILARYRSSDENELSKTNQSDLKLSATHAENSSKEAAHAEKQPGLKRGAEDCDNSSNKRRCLRLLED